MNKISTLIVISLGVILGFGWNTVLGAGVDIPGDNILREPSIDIGPIDGSLTGAQNLGFRILGLLKLLVSGFALIYLVVIGVFMVLHADTEDRIKTQRRQILYALIGFVFLNIPGMMWDVFRPNEVKGTIDTVRNWNDVDGGSLFWSTYGFEGLMGNIIAFLRVFAYGAAIVTLTWGILRLLLSGGNDERQKNAKHRITYGVLGLIFLGFVEGWSRMIAIGDFEKSIPFVANKFLSIAIFFLAPIAIFMIIWGSYHYITSAGDEERAKKGKQIVIGTLIGSLVVLSAFSFFSELINFSL